MGVKSSLCLVLKIMFLVLISRIAGDWSGVAMQNMASWGGVLTSSHCWRLWPWRNFRRPCMFNAWEASTVRVNINRLWQQWLFKILLLSLLSWEQKREMWKLSLFPLVHVLYHSLLLWNNVSVSVSVFSPCRAPLVLLILQGNVMVKTTSVYTINTLVKLVSLTENSSSYSPSGHMPFKWIGQNSNCCWGLCFFQGSLGENMTYYHLTYSWQHYV